MFEKKSDNFLKVRKCRHCGQRAKKLLLTVVEHSAGLSEAICRRLPCVSRGGIPSPVQAVERRLTETLHPVFTLCLTFCDSLLYEVHARGTSGRRAPLSSHYAGPRRRGGASARPFCFSQLTSVPVARRTHSLRKAQSLASVVIRIADCAFSLTHTHARLSCLVLFCKILHYERLLKLWESATCNNSVTHTV